MSGNGDIFFEIFGILLTIAAYILARRTSTKTVCGFKIGKIPAVVSTGLILCAVIALTPMSLADYSKGGDIIVMLLAPVTLSLALPLYKFRRMIAENFAEVGLATVLSTLASVASIVALGLMFNLDSGVLVSLSSKCVTTPVAVEITKSSRIGILEIAVLGVFVSGMTGAFFGLRFMDAIRIKSDVAKGLAMGAVSHVIGASICGEKNAKQSAFAALVLITSAIFTALCASIFFRIFEI